MARRYAIYTSPLDETPRPPVTGDSMTDYVAYERWRHENRPDSPYCPGSYLPVPVTRPDGKAWCPVCGQVRAVRADGQIRNHKTPRAAR